MGRRLAGQELSSNVQLSDNLTNRPGEPGSFGSDYPLQIMVLGCGTNLAPAAESLSQSEVEKAMERNTSPTVEPFQDQRKLRRIQISLPIRVRGTNSEGIQFEETSRSIDVNANGVLFPLKQELKKGARLKLSLPLPRSMQKTAASKPVYETEAVVVRAEAGDDPGTRWVAVRFRSASSKAYFQEAS